MKKMQHTWMRGRQRALHRTAQFARPLRVNDSSNKAHESVFTKTRLANPFECGEDKRTERLSVRVHYMSLCGRAQVLPARRKRIKKKERLQRVDRLRTVARNSAPRIARTVGVVERIRVGLRSDVCARRKFLSDGE